jgi:hypothetical protein
MKAFIESRRTLNLTSLKIPALRVYPTPRPQTLPPPVAPLNALAIAMYADQMPRHDGIHVGTDERILVRPHHARTKFDIDEQIPASDPQHTVVRIRVLNVFLSLNSLRLAEGSS